MDAICTQQFVLSLSSVSADKEIDWHHVGGGRPPETTRVVRRQHASLRAGGLPTVKLNHLWWMSRPAPLGLIPSIALHDGLLQRVERVVEQAKGAAAAAGDGLKGAAAAAGDGLKGAAAAAGDGLKAAADKARGLWDKFAHQQKGGKQEL
jgi:hypothetical protein